MDLLLNEFGDGGELALQGNDIATLEGWNNMIYLAMFGGNIEGSTKDTVLGELKLDWWGNNLFMPNDSSIQFNSTTENTLRTVALTSAGRLAIQKAVEYDLIFMKDFADVTVIVTIPATDRVEIEIQVRQPLGLQGATPGQYRAYIMVWDATLQLLGDFSILDFNDDFFV